MQQPTVLGEPEAKADQGFCCRQFTGDQERITQSPQYQASSRVLAYNESPDARHLLCPILSSPSFLSVGISPSGQRFRKKENTCCAVADILVVLILNAILFGAESFAEVGKKPDRLFIHANSGIVFVIGATVYFKHVFHRSHKSGTVFRRNTPALLQVRLKFVF